MGGSIATIRVVAWYPTEAPRRESYRELSYRSATLRKTGRGNAFMVPMTARRMCGE